MKIKHLFFIFLFANTSFSHTQDTQNIKTVGTFSLCDRIIEIQKDDQENLIIDHRTICDSSVVLRGAIFSSVLLALGNQVNERANENKNQKNASTISLEFGTSSMLLGFGILSAFVIFIKMYNNCKITGNPLLFEKHRRLLFSANDRHFAKEKNSLVGYTQFKFGNTKTSKQIRNATEKLISEFSKKENQKKDNPEFYEIFTELDKKLKQLFDNHYANDSSPYSFIIED